MLLQEVVNEYFISRSHLSENTKNEYGYSFKRLVKSIGDKPFAEITAYDIDKHLASLNHLTSKTMANIHVGLSSLWVWAVKRGYATTNIMHLVEKPRYKRRKVVPYTKEEVQKMLNASTASASYTRPGKRESRHSLPDVTVYRDQAIILSLLDTGCRVSELCSANCGDLNGRSLLVRGKGDKERLVFSRTTPWPS